MAKRQELADDQELLSVAQAAIVLGNSRWHVYDLINSGQLPRRLGGRNRNRYKLTRADLDEYMASLHAPIEDGAA